MRSFKSTLTALAFTTLAAGALMAQPPARHMFPDGFRGGPAGGPQGHMYAALGLTDAQKTQAQAIFDDERTSSKAIHQSLMQQRQSVQAAIDAGKSPDEVAQIAETAGPQLAQLEGIHAAAQAKFHAILTPEQRQKMTTMHQRVPGAGRVPRQAQ